MNSSEVIYVRVLRTAAIRVGGIGKSYKAAKYRSSLVCVLECMKLFNIDSNTYFFRIFIGFAETAVRYIVVKIGETKKLLILFLFSRCLSWFT